MKLLSTDPEKWYILYISKVSENNFIKRVWNFIGKMDVSHRYIIIYPNLVKYEILLKTILVTFCLNIFLTRNHDKSKVF